MAVPKAGQPRAWDGHRDLPSGGQPMERGRVTKEVLGEKSPAISSKPASLHKQLSTSPGARSWLCTGRTSRAISLEHSGRGPQKRWADPAGLLQRCVRTSAWEASGENTEFPELLHPAAPVRRVPIVTSACFLRVRDLIYLVKESVAVRLTAGKQLC